MEILGPAGESLRLSERYRQMSDDELIALARGTSELTDLAQQALAQEISQRRLKMPHDEPLTPPVPAPPPDLPANDDPYADEHQLVEINTVWSLADALQVQTLLDTAGIPFYMGPEKASGVEAVTSNFAEGVSVQVMRVGMPWAQQALQHYTPKNAPAETAGTNEPEPVDVAIRCPRCHSTEVVFDRLVSEPADGKSSPKFLWSCDSCGYKWEDEGIETER